MWIKRTRMRVSDHLILRYEGLGDGTFIDWRVFTNNSGRVCAVQHKETVSLFDYLGRRAEGGTWQHNFLHLSCLFKYNIRQRTIVEVGSLAYRGLSRGLSCFLQGGSYNDLPFRSLTVEGAMG